MCPDFQGNEVHNLNFSSEIHEIDRRAVAKRGKLPGIKNNPKLGQIM